MLLENLELRELLAVAPSMPFVVTTAADSGPGSLRQAILNADAQAGSSPVDISFEISTSDPGYNSLTGVWTISIESELPAITTANVTIDGTTQPDSVPQPELGTGGTVGVDALPLAQVQGPSIQIVDALTYGEVSVGLDVQAGDTTIKGLSISGFGDWPFGPGNANIYVTSTSPGTLIEGNVIGAPVNGESPASPTAAGGDIEVYSAAPGTIENNLIINSQSKGIELGAGSDGWTVQGNEIRGDGINNWNLDGMDVEGSGDETITGNLIDANWANGIDSYQSFGGNQIVDNTVSGNGVGTYSYEEDAGIRLYGTGSLVKSNIISGNYGAGVLVASGSLGDTITQDSFSGNGTVTDLAGDSPTGELGIDIEGPSDDPSQGTFPYVTPNDPGASRDGINGPANFPIFTATQIQDGQLTISGFARPGAVIELYLTTAYAGGFGQGQTYLGTFTEGSSADLDSGTGSYGPIVNGIAVGSDTTDRFEFSIPTPLDVSPGAYVTATATENGSTSEFGPQSQVVGVSGPLTYQATGTIPNAIVLRQNGPNVEILDDGTVVDREPLSLATSVLIQGVTAGTDQLTVDDSSGGPFTIPGGIAFQGGTGATDTLNVVGNGLIGGSYVPSATSAGSSSIVVGSQSIGFSGVAGLTLSQLSALTVETPSSGNVLAIDSPAAAQNRIDGTSGGVAITPVIFASIPGVTLNTAINDGGSTGDSVTIGTSGFVAAGLANFAIDTGLANDTLTILAPSLNLPVSGGSLSFNGGPGFDTLIAQADVNYTLTATGLSIPGSGSIALANVEDVQLTGGPDSSQFQVTGWLGNLALDGGPGLGSLAFSEPGPFGGAVTLRDFTSTSISIQGTFSGQITGLSSTTIQSVVIGGSLTAGASIAAGSFRAGAGQTTPAILVIGDVGGTIDAIEDPTVTGSGVITSIEIDGSLLAPTGQILAGSIGSLLVKGNLGGQVIAQGAGTIGTVTVDGNLTGTVAAPEDSNPGSGTISMVTVSGSLSGTVSSGDISGVTVGGDLSGTVIAQGAGTIGTVTVDGNLTGNVDAPEDSNPGSGTIQTVTVTGSLSGTVSSGSISGVTVGGNLSGTVIAQGSGTIGTVTVDGNLSGTVSAPEDSNPGSGTIQMVTVTGTLCGTVSSGSISGVTVGGNLSGTVIAQGAGTIGTVTVDGSLTGNVDAPEDTNPGSGTITMIDVMGTLSGTVSSGSISGVTVGGNLSGTVIAQGAGTIGTVTVDGNLSGTVSAPEDPNPGSGKIGMVSVSGSLSGTVSSGNISGVTVGDDLSGTVIAQGAGTIGTVTVDGNLTGNVDAPEDSNPGSGTIQMVTVTGSLSGTVSSGSISGVTVGGNLSGTVIAQGAGTIGTVTVDGNLSGTVMAPEDSNPGSGTIAMVTVTGSLSGTVSSGDISGVMVGSDLSGTVIAQGAGTIGTVTVDGNLSGTVSAPEDTNPGSGKIQMVTVDGTLCGTVSSGSISGVTVGGNLSGTVIAQGAGTIGTVTVDGNLTGNVDAPEDSNPGSGTIQMVTVTGSLSGTVSSGSISGVTVGGNLSGTVIAQGSGTIGTVTVDGNLTGNVDAPEDSNPGSGTIQMVTVTGSLSGTVSSGDISGVVVGGNLSGTVIAQGAGTIGTVTVDGNLTGTVSAPEDTNAGSGTINMVTVSGSLSGTVSSGAISGVSVGGDLSGTVIAQGAGHLGQVLVKGSVSGLLDAVLDSTGTSGEIDSLTVNGSVTGLISAIKQLGSGVVFAISPTGQILTGNVLSSLNVTASSGNITASNVAKFVGGPNIGGTVTVQSVTTLSLQSLSGIFTVTNTLGTGAITVTLITPTGFLNANSTGGTVKIGTVQGKVNLGSAGSVEYATLAAGSQINASSITSLTIDTDLAGSVVVTGDLHTLNVPGGSIDAGASVGAASLESATIGGNLAGQILVSGTLGSLAVGGSTPGSIVAGHVGTISAGAGAGSFVLQVTDNGVHRLVEATTPANPYPQPGAVVNVISPLVTFRYLYESGSLANPQLTVQVTNASSTAADQFDLSLVTDSDTAKFNLARLDAVGISGIRNVDVEGDILTAITSQATAFFPGDTNAAGIRLPSDKLAAVGVRDFIPYGGYIKATSIQAISAGLFGRSGNQTVLGSSATQTDAQNALASGTKIVEAADTFRVPFADLAADQVGFFMDSSGAGSFNWSSVNFTVESVTAANAAGTANVVTQSNIARGSDIALIKVVALNSSSSQIQEIDINGDGGSISTQQYINGPITSTGPLGDLSLLTSSPIGSITAPSIFGTIYSYGLIAGTIQTTGVRTDPITGATSTVPADFGRVYLNSSNKLTMTALTINGGTFAGRVIVRGNLLTAVTLNGGLTGLIAAQGNVGAAYGTTRLGGVTVNGNDTGTILSLGQILGDVTLNGGLNGTGAIAGEGGILGNTTINGGIASGANVVSEGAIGSSTYGTKLTVNGTTNGLIVAGGNLTLTAYPLNASHTFANATGTPNAAAVDAIFTVGTTGLGAPELFDSAPGALDLVGLNEILTDLVNLHIGKNGKLTVVPGA